MKEITQNNNVYKFNLSLLKNNIGIKTIPNISIIFILLN